MEWVTLRWNRLERTEDAREGGRLQSEPVADLARNKQSMTKADLVADVAKTSGLTRPDAEVVVKTVLDSIVEALSSGEKVELRGFRYPRRSRQYR